VAFDEDLTARIRDHLAHQPGVEEKRLFGGVGFLLNGHVFAGVWKDALFARLGAEACTAALADPSARPFDPAGKPMKGWVLIDPDGREGARLGDWIERALAFVHELPPK
jgi:TfoX/Sxy family transcriptional regulator of competence genes